MHWVCFPGLEKGLGLNSLRPPQVFTSLSAGSTLESPPGLFSGNSCDWVSAGLVSTRPSLPGPLDHHVKMDVPGQRLPSSGLCFGESPHTLKVVHPDPHLGLVRGAHDDLNPHPNQPLKS